MIISQEARAARKSAQTARLKAKADDPDSYPAFYATQPVQIAKAELNAQISTVRQEIRSARASVDLARATGENITAAELAVDLAQSELAALETLRQRRFKPNAPGATIGGAA